MIVSSNITPDRDLYFLGSKVIEVLISSEEIEVDYFELFQRVNTELEISLNLYTLVLDWLFIIGVINNAENGLMMGINYANVFYYLIRVNERFQFIPFHLDFPSPCFKDKSISDALPIMWSSGTKPQ